MSLKIHDLLMIGSDLIENTDLIRRVRMMQWMIGKESACAADTRAPQRDRIQARRAARM